MNAKTLFAAVVVAGAAVVGASQASAMPVAPQSSTSGIDLVRMGCGPGWHPNWRTGRCVPNRSPYYRRYRRW
ncbi:MAG: hypothetical protein QM651_11835 [Rhodoblastus sp.]